MVGYDRLDLIGNVRLGKVNAVGLGVKIRPDKETNRRD